MRHILLPFFLLQSTLLFAGPPIDVQHYRFEIELSDQSDAIQGKAWISIRFGAAASVAELDLVSADEGKGMQVFAVKEGNQPLRFVHANDRLTVYLAQPANTEAVRTLEVSYMGIPKDGLIISRNKYGERTFFSDNWPDRARHWIPCNDTPSDKASVEFTVTAPSHYRIISNGLLTGEKAHADGKRTTSWKEDLPIPTKIMVIGAADFAVSRVDSAYHVPVTAWVYKQDSVKGVYDYALADDILRYFENYIAPYPYKKLANVQSKTIFGGMENASAIFYAENSVTGDRSSETLIAHEIAHQWFGNTATEKSFAHVWLSEGFANYLADMYMEDKYGVDSFRSRLKEARREVVDFVRTSRLPVVDSASSPMDLLSPNSYQKGAWILHMLRNETGDTLFRRIIRAYYDQYKFGNADTRDFQKVAERVSGKDLNSFFDQWLYQPGIPELELSWKYGRGKVQVYHMGGSGMAYKDLPTELLLKYKDGRSEKHLLRLDSIGHVVVLIEVAEKPVQIILDPETKLLFRGRIREVR